MYKTISITFLFILVALTQCTSRSSIDKETLQQIIAKQDFSFQAERIIPISNEAIKAIDRKSGASSNVLNVHGDGYVMIVKPNQLILDLPYFGRSYSSSRSGKVGVHYTSNNYQLVNSIAKDGHLMYTFTPKDLTSVQEIYLDIYDNGKAYLSINFRDRQAISYSGIISK